MDFELVLLVLTSSGTCILLNVKQVLKMGNHVSQTDIFHLKHMHFILCRAEYITGYDDLCQGSSLWPGWAIKNFLSSRCNSQSRLCIFTSPLQLRHIFHIIDPCDSATLLNIHIVQMNTIHWQSSTLCLLTYLCPVVRWIFKLQLSWFFLGEHSVQEVTVALAAVSVDGEFLHGENFLPDDGFLE